MGMLAALGLAGALVVLWFTEVRALLCRCRSIVECAEAQVKLHRRNAAMAAQDDDLAAILARSEDIYRQAVNNYNGLLSRPWIGLPAVLMHFSAV